MTQFVQASVLADTEAAVAIQAAVRLVIDMTVGSIDLTNAIKTTTRALGWGRIAASDRGSRVRKDCDASQHQKRRRTQMGDDWSESYHHGRFSTCVE
jgi:hypothetical protein